MKTKYIFLILCFLGIAMGSCKDDSASNPTFADLVRTFRLEAQLQPTVEVLGYLTDRVNISNAIAGNTEESPFIQQLLYLFQSIVHNIAFI